MALELLPCRGSVFRIGDGDGDSFSLDPGLSGSESSPIILQSLNVDDRVVNLPVTTLDNVRILYVFGKAWGEIGVGGLALLGEGGSGGALAAVVDWFEANSADASDTEVSASLPGGIGYKFYATGLNIGDPNAEFQFFPFMVYGKIIGT